MNNKAERLLSASSALSMLNPALGIGLAKWRPWR